MSGDQPASEPHAPDHSHRRTAGFIVVGGMALALGLAMTSLPHDAHHPLPEIARQALVDALPRWHTTEPVNEVVYGTRGFDTFGETFLLLAAVVSVLSITRGRERRRTFLQEERLAARERRALEATQARTASFAGRDSRSSSGSSASAPRQADREERGDDVPGQADVDPLGQLGPEHSREMTVVVRGGIITVLPVLLVAGLYLVAWGYSPGGGFPGGAVLLGGVLLAYAAFGYRRVRPVVRPDLIELVEFAGAVAIVAVELGGFLWRGSFSANFLPLGRPQTILSGGVLQAFSAGELIEVGSGLVLVVFSVLAMQREWSDEQSAE